MAATQTAPSFLLVFRETSPETYAAMSTEQRREALRKWNGWIDALAAEGRMQGGNTLAPEGRIVSGARGTVVDGPFAEAKEAIGGYILLTAASLDEAVEVARGAPNIPHGMEVEVRPVAQACHLARSLGMTTMRGEPALA